MHWRIRLNETVSLTQKSPYMESVNVQNNKKNLKTAQHSPSHKESYPWTKSWPSVWRTRHDGKWCILFDGDGQGWWYDDDDERQDVGWWSWVSPLVSDRVVPRVLFKQSPITNKSFYFSPNGPPPRRNHSGRTRPILHVICTWTWPLVEC